MLRKGFVMSGARFNSEIVLHLPIHRADKKKPHYQKDSGVSNAYTAYLAPRPGLEPGTYGLTVRRSTN